MGNSSIREIELNPYQPPPAAYRRSSTDDGMAVKRLVIALFAFFIAFWAGAIAIFVCVVLHERGLL